MNTSSVMALVLSADQLYQIVGTPIWHHFVGMGMRKFFWNGDDDIMVVGWGWGKSMGVGGGHGKNSWGLWCWWGQFLLPCHCL